MSSILNDEWPSYFEKCCNPDFCNNQYLIDYLITFNSYFRHICRHLNEDIRTHHYKRSYDKLEKIGPEKNHWAVAARDRIQMGSNIVLSRIWVHISIAKIFSFTKAVTYDERPKMKRDAWLKAVFFIKKLNCREFKKYFFKVNFF